MTEGPLIGWHASHEQIAPGPLLRAAVYARDVGFTDAMCSDHLAPWSHAQGESGFAFSWLGATLEATGDMTWGQFHAPGQRYHPVISAHAIATLAAMYPGRYPWIALGSGEALNEHVTGDAWPAKPVREQRLRECVEVIRALLAGDEVSHSGLVHVHEARIWSRPAPADVPLLLGGAVSVRTAAWAASWADGLVTANADVDQVRAVVDAYRDAGGRGQVMLQVHVSWAPDEERALAIAVDQWRTNLVPHSVVWDLTSPDEFERASRDVTADDVRSAVLVTDDMGRLAGWLHGYLDVGVDGIYVHHVGKEQAPFLDACGSRLLPDMRGVRAGASA